jgi:hypothetical protein
MPAMIGSPEAVAEVQVSGRSLLERRSKDRAAAALVMVPLPVREIGLVGEAIVLVERQRVAVQGGILPPLDGDVGRK